MSGTEKIKHDLFHYFEARGVVAGHVICSSEFTEHMTPGYHPEEVAAIASVFAQLAADGVFEEQTPGEFILTAKGLDLLREDRVHTIA